MTPCITDNILDAENYIHQLNLSADLKNIDITRFQWRKISALCDRRLGTVDVALSSKFSLKFLHFCYLHTCIYVSFNTCVRHILIFHMRLNCFSCTWHRLLYRV